MSQLDNYRISLDRIKEATDNFSEDNFIGYGGFGWVYGGVLSHFNGRSVVAVKRSDPTIAGQGETEFQAEIEMLSRFRGKNILSLLGFCDESDERILVYEYAFNGSLEDHLSDFTGLTWTKRLEICIGAARGLRHLHIGGGGRDRLIHRDIKSANILLDKNWVAKISDFGLSKIGPRKGRNQANSQLITQVVGTPMYCDPEYQKTEILTKESDVYSFGVVLLEILSGSSATDESFDDESLVDWFKNCFKNETVEDLVASSVCKQMVDESLLVFSMLANECLRESREDRPTMDTVISYLEVALEHQLSYESYIQEELAEEKAKIEEKLAREKAMIEEEAYWKKKLPQEVDEISKRLNISRRYNNKELFSLLHSGILYHEKKRLFWMDDRGRKYEMISAFEFLRSHPGYYTMEFESSSRFFRVAEFRNLRYLNLQIKIKTEGLSPGVMYAANLVFKYLNYPRKSSDLPGYVGLKYKFNDGKSSAPYLQQWIDNGWVKIQMWHYQNVGENSEFDVLLESFPDYGLGMILDGIEFRPMETCVDHQENPTENQIQIVDEETEKVQDVKNQMDGLTVTDSDVDWDEKLPSDYEEIIQVDHDTTRKELYFLLCEGILIDNGEMWFSISKLNGKKSHMLAATKAIDISEREHWNWKYLPESRFSKVAELLPQETFHITCGIKSKLASLETNYECYLVYKLAQNFQGLEGALKISVKFGGTDPHDGYLHLISTSPLIKPKNDHSSQTIVGISSQKFEGLVSQRKDGWMEIKLVPFTLLDLESDGYHPLHIQVSTFTGNMSGLIIEGIEFRPTT